MKYWSNCGSQEPHLAFFGRWCPLHKGHVAIVRKKMAENPGMPILILVRDTAFDKYDAEFRLELVVTWMEAENLKGTVLVVPDINGVFWGRGVGYNVEEVLVEEEIKAISATGIREMISAGNDEWKELIAHPKVAELLEKKI